MDQTPGGVPSGSALHGLMSDLTRALDGLSDTHRRLLSLRGVAWSADRTVKVEVGPRGQLVDLEIDPRVFRRPDAAALRADLLRSYQAALGQVAEQTREIVAEQVPPEVGELRRRYRAEDDTDPLSQLLVTDADLLGRGRDA